MLWVVFMIKD